MRVGVLALQGAFEEHIAKLKSLGIGAFEIRALSDISDSFDGLVLPGGESTVMKKLLCELGLFKTLKQHIQNGLPVLGTCAGMILLADKIDGGEEGCFMTMDITVKRNAYGRQLGSFRCDESFNGKKVEMRFIRAPYATKAGDGVDILSVHDGRIVAVREGNQLATAFHPELTDDNTVYDMFTEMIRERLKNQ